MSIGVLGVRLLGKHRGRRSTITELLLSLRWSHCMSFHSDALQRLHWDQEAPFTSQKFSFHGSTRIHQTWSPQLSTLVFPFTPLLLHHMGTKKYPMGSEIWTLKSSSRSEGADKDLLLRSMVQFRRIPPNSFLGVPVDFHGASGMRRLYRLGKHLTSISGLWQTGFFTKPFLRSAVRQKD